MPRLRMAMAGFVLAAVVAFPRSASASIIDFIWEMSGPQMVGLIFYCEFDPSTKQLECRAFDKRVYGNARPRAERRLWLNIPGAGYISTGKDSDDREYDFGKAQLFSFEPALEVRSITRRLGVMHHGIIGLSYFFLTGSGFEHFDKVGLKFVPIGFTFRNGVNLALSLRVFPNGFTADEFGVGTRQHDVDRPWERVYGVAFGWGYN